MSAYGSWTPPIIPQGEGFVYFAPQMQPMLPQQLCAGPKHAPRQHKKHGTCSANRPLLIDSFDIPLKATCSPVAPLCLSALSAFAFTCALVFHGLMFYYAFETPMWLVMCWPLVLLPPIILNSIYLAVKAKRAAPNPNSKMVYLYLLFSTAYVAWATYFITTIYKEGKCNEVSYYSLMVSVLAMATVACALEWWAAVSKIMQHTTMALNATVSVFEKSPTKRKLYLTLKHNGKVVKELSFNMSKIAQDYNIIYNGQFTPGGVLYFNTPARYGNEKYKQCPMKHQGQGSANGSLLSNTVCHYENEKLTRELLDGTPSKSVADQYENEKLHECVNDDLPLNNDTTQNNKIV